MTEIILACIILALVVTNVYLFQRMMEMNEKYMKAIMAKNLTQYDQSVILDKVDTKTTVKEEPVPLEQADDSTFTKFLKTVTNGQEQPEV